MMNGNVRVLLVEFVRLARRVETSEVIRIFSIFSSFSMSSSEMVGETLEKIIRLLRETSGRMKISVFRTEIFL